MKKYCKPFKRGASWRSQNFRAYPNNGANGPGGHTGNDDACSIGTPVHAAGDGIIEFAGVFDNSYHDNLLWLIDFGGNTIVLNCGNDEPSFVYAHLSRFLVKTGDRVSKGQVIALSGNSGTRTTGPHLHSEAIAPGYVLNSLTLGRVNPDAYMTEWPDDRPTINLASTGTEELDMTTATEILRVVNSIKDDTARATQVLNAVETDGIRAKIRNLKLPDTMVKGEEPTVYVRVDSKYVGIGWEEYTARLKLGETLAKLTQPEMDALLKATGS